MDIRFVSTIRASTQDIFALLTQREFQAEKAARLGVLDFAMETVPGDGRLLVRTRRTVATQGLPEFVKSLLTPTMEVIETETWEQLPRGHEAASGGFAIDVHGAPVKLTGRVDLVPLPDGDAQVCFTGTLNATVPLFRSRIEEASSGAIFETMQVEAELLGERLHTAVEWARAG